MGRGSSRSRSFIIGNGRFWFR
eukprot:SAG31_NODE_41659_length_275_cov_0.585227_1_plen_21_part_01